MIKITKQQPNYDDLHFTGTMVTIREDETLDQALKRFKKVCIRDGIMLEWKKHQFYESPSVKRKKKSEAAQRKLRKYHKNND